MPWNDGISKLRSYSLTDIHDYEQCVFRFLVRHHLEHKQEIDDSSPKMALGTILDEAIKLYHLSTVIDDPQYLAYVVRGAVRHIKENVIAKGEKSFYYKHNEFISEPLIQQAIEIFRNYYLKLDGKIKKSIARVGFCEYIFEASDGKIKLWGGPDTYELGDDGIPEIVDYKYHEDPEKGAARLDMDLMPKIYTLLSAKQLKDLGYKKARFIVRQWTNPGYNKLAEEFDLDNLDSVIEHIRSKIDPILTNKAVSFCERSYCRACKSNKREAYLQELKEKNMVEVLESPTDSLTSKFEDALFAPDRIIGKIVHD